MSGSRNAPLAGFTVVEHAQGVAASYAGRMMAVMGATVIKVEPPGEGCALRRAEPLLTQDPPASALFHYLNAGKQFVTCDVGTDDGRRRMDELMTLADLLIDDTPVLSRAQIGLDPQAVAARHPELVYLSVLPFGACGVHADYRAYELNVFHAGGEGFLMPNGLTLEMFPERPPVKIYGHFAELIGGTSAVCAGVSALLVRDEIGGQFVDVSVQDANVSVGCFAIQRLGDGVLENRHGRSFKYGGVLECSDGYVGVLTLEQRQWEGLVKLIGDPEWARDPVWRDPLERSRRGAEINRHLRAWAKTQRVEDVVKKGQALSVPLAKYNQPADISGVGAIACARNFCVARSSRARTGARVHRAVSVERRSACVGPRGGCARRRQSNDLRRFQAARPCGTPFRQRQARSADNGPASSAWRESRRLYAARRGPFLRAPAVVARCRMHQDRDGGASRYFPQAASGLRPHGRCDVRSGRIQQAVGAARFEAAARQGTRQAPGGDERHRCGKFPAGRDGPLGPELCSVESSEARHRHGVGFCVRTVRPGAGLCGLRAALRCGRRPRHFDRLRGRAAHRNPARHGSQHGTDGGDGNAGRVLVQEAHRRGTACGRCRARSGVQFYRRCAAAVRRHGYRAAPHGQRRAANRAA